MASEARDITGSSGGPADSVRGDLPMTGAQESYLNHKARQAGEPPVNDLTAAQALEKILGYQQWAGWGIKDSALSPHTNGGKARRSP